MAKVEILLAQIQQVLESFWVPLIQDGSDDVDGFQIVWEVIFVDGFEVDDVWVAFGSVGWKIKSKMEIVALDLVDVSHVCRWKRSQG